MYCVKEISSDTFWVGGNDRRLALFENVFPIPRGVSYNSYLILDEKTVLLDTVDKSVSGVFFENLEYLLAGRKLDYLVVNHMEPDHCATLQELVLRHPEVKIIGNSKTLVMIKQFFTFDIDSRAVTVKEGDSLSTGKHHFTFVMAPMVHWPEAMVTYDATDKVLYSADAFGTFGALNGNIFADQVDFDRDWMDDARRYYTNIVGKYGTQVQALLNKAAGLEIEMICPLHGPVWRKNIGHFMDKYWKWSTYTPEETAVMVVYASVYGNTENTAEIIASGLSAGGIHNVVMYDVSAVHPSVIVAEAFRCSHIVFASTTYNAGIFCNMETVLLDLKAHNLQNRTVAVVENGTWAASSGKLIKDILASMKNITVLDETLSLKSSLKQEQLPALQALTDAILASVSQAKEKQTAAVSENRKVEPNAMFKLSYGLFVLTAQSKDGKDNGCIINTVMQVTDSPKRITIAVNKANYTHDLILKSGIFNVSVLTEDAPFKVFQQFGFQSGRDADKFAGCEGDPVRSENGLRYIPKYTNAFLSGKVIKAEDMGTHTLFTAEVTEAKVLSDGKSVTYAYYFENIKPKPQPTAEKKKGFVCKICGYVYEGDELPPDFVCPLCKHGAEDFEPLS
jgi:flavorubredoxin/flavin reductase (DIM6/NTAB) family NADH-FMN oxidoreductase RutF